MNRHQQTIKHTTRRGSALPLAVVAIIILLAMGVGLLSLGYNGRIYAVRNASGIAARCAADTGLEMALSEMNQMLQAEKWNESALPKATNIALLNCNEVCSYSVTSDPVEGYVVLSYGESANAKRSVRATLRLQGLFEHAILTKDDLVLKAGTTVDSYNSLKPFDDTSGDADIGTQSIVDSSIILNMGVTVDGDVKVGVGGNPKTVIKDMGATITGNQSSDTSQELLPNITAPTDLLDKGTKLYAQGKTISVSPSDSGQYSDIVLKNSDSPGVLQIEGGDVVLHITGGVYLGQSCQINIAEGSTLKLYVDGNINCRESSGINTNNPPTQAETLQIYGTNTEYQSFDIKANSQFTGVIYAPNADVDLYAGGDIYGSVVAQTFEFKAGGDYHYDQALRVVDKDDPGVRFAINRWEEAVVQP